MPNELRIAEQVQPDAYQLGMPLALNREAAADDLEGLDLAEWIVCIHCLLDPTGRVVPFARMATNVS